MDIKFLGLKIWFRRTRWLPNQKYPEDQTDQLHTNIRARNHYTSKIVSIFNVKVLFKLSIH